MINLYKHTQTGYLLLIIYSIIILFVVSLIIVTGFNPFVLGAMIILLIALGSFSALTVVVDDRMIQIRFGFGVIRKTFLLKEIELFRPVRNPWYYGWGIRFTPRGWLFNVSGFSAIELQKKNGKLYRIGTDDIDKLTKALEGALNDSSGH